MRTRSKERLTNSPPATPGQAEKATRPDTPRPRVIRTRSSGNGQAGEQSFESMSNSTIDLTSSPEAPKKQQKRNLKRGLSVDRQEPSTSSAGAGGGKKKAGSSPKPPEKKSGQTSQKGTKKPRGKQIDLNDNFDGGAKAEMIQRLNKVVADLNKENRLLTDENKKLKETAATDGTALAKEKAEKANLKEANSKLQNDVDKMTKELEVFRGWKDARMTKLESTIARVEKEKSDMEKTLAMLQNEVGQADELREKNTRLERDKQELEKTLATLQVPAGSQLEDAFRQALECPICFNVRTLVVQCVNSHPICTQCQQGMQECPVCKVAYSAGVHRNRVAEELVRALNNA